MVSTEKKTLGANAVASREAAAAAVVRGLVNHGILQRDWPIRAIVRFRRDCIVKKEHPDQTEFGPCASGGRRGVIKEFSNQARYRLLHFVKNCDCEFASMMTLTYPSEFPCDGRTVKRDHFEKFRRWFLLHFPLETGVWFLEFQKRGAPHFHILLSVVLQDQGDLVTRKRVRKKNGEIIRTSYQTSAKLEKMLAEKWYQIVGSEDPKHLKAGVAWETIVEADGALRYSAAHAGKCHQKEVPALYQNVGAFWGKLGPIYCEPIEEIVLDAAEIFRVYGHQAMSKEGKIKKYLWDSSEQFRKVTKTFPDSDPDQEKREWLEA